MEVVPRPVSPAPPPPAPKEVVYVAVAQRPISPAPQVPSSASVAMPQAHPVPYQRSNAGTLAPAMIALPSSVAPSRPISATGTQPSSLRVAPAPDLPNFTLMPQAGTTRPSSAAPSARSARIAVPAYVEDAPPTPVDEKPLPPPKTPSVLHRPPGSQASAAQHSVPSRGPSTHPGHRRVVSQPMPPTMPAPPTPHERGPLATMSEHPILGIPRAEAYENGYPAFTPSRPGTAEPSSQE